MPDVRHKQGNTKDARHGQLSDRDNSQESGAENVTSEEAARQAVQDLREQTSQSNTSAVEEVQSNHKNLNRYAESQGALKGASEQERKDLGAALRAFGGRQEEHLGARQKAVDGVAKTADHAVADLKERQAKELQEAPEAERSKVVDRHQAQWTEAQKILEEARAGVETLRAADDARLKEARGKVGAAATGSAADLAARLKDDAQNTQTVRVDLGRDAEQVRERLVKSFNSLQTASRQDKKADAVDQAAESRPEMEAKRPRKQSQQVPEPEKQVKAGERKERLEKEIAKQHSKISDDEEGIRTRDRRLDELIKNPKKAPPELAEDLANLPSDPDERLEALQELRKKQDLSSAAIEYLKWNEELQDLKLEKAGRVIANTKFGERLVTLVDWLLPEAERNLRKARQTVKDYLRQVGPHYKARSKVNYDEILGEDRSNDLGLKNNDLQTDHLISLDWIANSDQLTGFLKVYVQASQTVKTRMLDDLVALACVRTRIIKNRASLGARFCFKTL